MYLPLSFFETVNLGRVMFVMCSILVALIYYILIIFCVYFLCSFVLAHCTWTFTYYFVLCTVNYHRWPASPALMGMSLLWRPAVNVISMIMFYC